MGRICVFCGSSPGRSPAYTEAAVELGQTLVARGLGLVYGGASVGLMGKLADTVLEAGGEVIGVIPDSLLRYEVTHEGLPDLRVVGSMAERKTLMAELSDGFISLPGGTGTLDEMFEMLTWSQLGDHDKPSGLLDVEGFYSNLIAFLDHAVEERFLRPEHRAMLMVETSANALLDRFESYAAPKLEKWIGRV
ncbi:MAG TPA: TIGR00730 family Rossman fold protein [Verrucomicrobiae bacterium]|jgi:uncharacterized protein (TIGR00730 family)|nr:TIGR00730 family Rossman fold protein [Verrucomicrobiae bacterium]